MGLKCTAANVAIQYLQSDSNQQYAGLLQLPSMNPAFQPNLAEWKQYVMTKGTSLLKTEVEIPGLSCNTEQ